MDRRVVAGIVGAALAGFAQPGPAQVGPDPTALPPVGLSPIPPLGDSINSRAGYPGRAEAPSTATPTNPTRSGPAAPVPRPPVLPGPVSLSPLAPIGQAINRGATAGAGATAAGPRSPIPTAPVSMSPMAPIGQAINRGVPTIWTPSTVPNTGRPATARPVAPANPSPGPRAIAPGPAIPTTLPELPPMEAQAAPAGRPAPFAGQLPGAARPQADPIPGTDAGVARPAPMADDQPKEPRPQAAAVDEPGTGRPRASSANVPSYRPAERPATDPSPVPDPAPPPIPKLDEAPGPESSPSTGPTMPIPVPEPVPTAQARPTGPAADPEVRRVSQDETAIKMNQPRPRELPFASRRAAAVGDEIITLDELSAVVSQRLEEVKDNVPTSDADRRQFINMVASQALDHMIDQAIIVQEANRRMRNPKAQKMFNDFVDKTWREDELPPLLRKTSSSNVFELKKKLSEQGKSYEAMKEAFRKKLLARDFLGAEIRNKVTCDLAEQRAYYNEHLRSYEQPARFTWREIEISFAKFPDRAAARKQAEAVLARLLRDEDFGAVARAVSHGPTASQGGLYADMSPGSYGIPIVNDELNRLPVGQVSGILEAPNAFHIVRVDSRREAGPLRFDEVQDRIRPLVMERNYQKAVEGYLAKLRARTLIRTMFDNSESDPNLVRRNDASVRPASNR